MKLRVWKLIAAPERFSVFPSKSRLLLVAAYLLNNERDSKLDIPCPALILEQPTIYYSLENNPNRGNLGYKKDFLMLPEATGTDSTT